MIPLCSIRQHSASISAHSQERIRRWTQNLKKVTHDAFKDLVSHFHRISDVPIPFVSTIVRLHAGLELYQYCLNFFDEDDLFTSKFIKNHNLFFKTLQWLEFARLMGIFSNCYAQISGHQGSWQVKLERYFNHHNGMAITLEELTSMNEARASIKTARHYIWNPTRWVEELEVGELQRLYFSTQKDHTNRLENSRSERPLPICDSCHLPCERWERIAIKSIAPYEICDVGHRTESKICRDRKTRLIETANNCIFPFANPPKTIESTDLNSRAMAEALLKIAIYKFGLTGVNRLKTPQLPKIQKGLVELRVKLNDRIMLSLFYQLWISFCSTLGYVKWTFAIEAATVPVKLFTGQTIKTRYNIGKFTKTLELAIILSLARLPLLIIGSLYHQFNQMCSQPLLQGLILSIIYQVIWAWLTSTQHYTAQLQKNAAPNVKMREAITEYLKRPFAIKNDFEDLLYQFLTSNPELIKSAYIAERLNLICPITLLPLIEQSSISLFNTNFLQPYHANCVDQILRGEDQLFKIGLARFARCPFTQQPIRAVIYPFRSGEQFISIRDSSLTCEEIERFKEQGLIYRDRLTAQMSREAMTIESEGGDIP